ncbi:MAG: diphthine--ammonia ligase [Syntrophales bacterium LBB04]|nr:diphthine--ammonia ligase [Syntrophales bacterium LBB04]
MKTTPSRAAVLWTGGKDSVLALYEARLSGLPIVNLVTFIPDGADFLAHPLFMMEAQAQALNLPHRTLTISEPFQENYEKAIASIGITYDVDTLVTGDISQVDGFPNWIRERSRPSGMKVFTPLWEKDRETILNRLLSLQFKVIFSGVKKPWLTEDWLGREITESALEQLKAFGRETGLDLCGEQGEYHTLVLDGPGFVKRIEIKGYSKEIRNDLAYMKIDHWVLGDKLVEANSF